MSNETRKRILRARIGCLTFGLGLIVLIYFISVGAFIPDKYRLLKKSAQQAVYQAVCAKCGESSFEIKEPYRIGKIWRVYSADGSPANRWLGYNPFEEIEAKTPDEVGTLVCVGKVVKAGCGQYENGQPAYQLLRNICLIDVATNTVVYETTLMGSAPPRSVSGREAGEGSDALYKLKDFILGLPEK